ncbi:amino acid permease [Robbsia sp. Bb-Pol-6]|uniref:Amino acid permease n=1 Tax=Robbsia betulipollinis TaxID=2981849 RepID=A0ABT3ZI42_9BURK|nr:amino acid permease [Robbsia betulipollinis]MCY0386092.1 amino acid permease [Robbsia betulipollinis]
MTEHSGISARKSVADIVDGAHGVRGGGQPMTKTLGATSITAMGIGAIVGAGIFVLTGTAAARYAGPAIMLSFVLGGVACAFVGLCYAELAALIPVSGSSYTYTYATLGELFAWMIGWDLILEYAMGGATVAVGWSGYVVSVLKNVGVTLPPVFTAAPGTAIVLDGGAHATALLNLPAAAIVLLLTGLLMLGTSESAKLNNVMVAVKLVVVVAFIALGAFSVRRINWTPFIPPNTGTFGHFGWSGILRGASVVFFAFIGFDAVSTAAQEAKRPQRDMPIGILGSLVICTVLYIAVAAVLTGLVPYARLNVADPIAKGVDVIGLPWFSILIKLGALTGLTTVILVLLYGQSRIFYTMAHDGLLPAVFARIHPRLRTPYLSQAMIGVVVAIVAALVPIGILGEMVSIGTLFAFTLVCAAVIYLRRSERNRPRPFRVPAVPVVPILGILFCLLLMFGLPLATWARLVIWLVLGLAVYFSYGRHHSALRGKEHPAKVR